MSALLLCLLLFSGPAPSERPGSDLGVTLQPTTSTIVLGDHLDVRIEVTNNGAVATAPLVAHLDVTDPASSVSVDPEDWTETLSKPAGVIAPGASVTLDWTVQPIAPGTFTVYAVALPTGSEPVPASNVLTVVVEDHRSVNPGGILPVSIGVPALTGALLLWRLRAVQGVATGRRRQTHSQQSD